MNGGLSRCLFGSILLAMMAPGRMPAQGTMHRQTAESDTTDASGHLKTGAAPNSTDRTANGQVVLADHSVADALVEISSDCDNRKTLLALTDTKGRFSINLRFFAPGDNCMIVASLDGYRSETKALPELDKSGVKLDKFELQPLSADQNGEISAADEQANKAQRKLYEKGREQAAKADFPKAIVTLKSAVSAYPDYASAWLALGILEHSGGSHTDAEKAFEEATRADPKFARAWIHAAASAAERGDWKATIERAERAIEINPTAFPGAYAWAARANVNLQNVDAAVKRATDGLKLDTSHQYPELEYALGLALSSTKDLEGATTHLEQYLKDAKNGSDAAAARSQLSQIRSALHVEEFQQAENPHQGKTALPQATVGALQSRNAPLLENTPVHTCLESISQIQFDTRGKPHDAELTRVEIAISDGQEIYDEAGGRRLASDNLASILHYTFSSTGLFSSIARAVIAGNDMQIDTGVEESLNGEPVTRYDFHLLPSGRGWAIQSANESGRAGEEGSFFVENGGMTLRRVVVRAVNIPRNLKLNRLDAEIDYEVETIAGRQVLLPSVGRVHAEERGGTERLSRLYFDHCRAFLAESTLSFGAEDQETRKAQRPERPDLPTGVEVAVSLVSPLGPGTAASTDIVAATIARPVSWSGHEMIPEGAAIEGHIRPRHGENAVVIEFDRVQTRSGWAPFYAHLVALDATKEAWMSGAKSSGKAAGARDEALADPEIPGVARLDFASKSATLPPGTHLIWKTEPLAATQDQQAPQLGTHVSMH